MYIGQKIKKVLREQGQSVAWLAEQIPCERTNVYNIFHRKDINIKLLANLSLILQHDFFKDLSEETFRGMEKP